MRGLIWVFLMFAITACTAKPPANALQSQAVAQVSPATALVGTETPVAPTQTPVAPEVNPPGDIPDSQAFVNYDSTAGGYRLDVPEGWARTENGSGVTFADKFDGVRVAIAPASAAPTAATARDNEAKQIEALGHAVTITGVSELTLPSGKAIVIKYTSNSDANAVTNKRLRLENEAVLYFRNGKEATLTLWAPLGADNVDQWDRMKKSFRWM